MHPYKMVNNRKDERCYSDKNPTNEVKLSIVTAIRNVQLSCTLLGGSTSKVTYNEEITKEEIKQSPQQEIIPVVIVTKCNCCKKVINKETVFVSDNTYSPYEISFVESNMIGVIKYELCVRCSKTKLTLVH